MTDPEQLRDLERELDRVVDRLTSMPLAKAASAADDCRRACLVIVEQTRRLTDDIPADADLPRAGTAGTRRHGRRPRERLPRRGAEVASDADLAPVIDALVGLRRALP